MNVETMYLDKYREGKLATLAYIMGVTSHHHQHHDAW